MSHLPTTSELRLKAKLTQEEAARQANVSTKTICRIDQWAFRRAPRKPVLQRVAKAYGCTPEHLRACGEEHARAASAPTGAIQSD